MSEKKKTLRLTHQPRPADAASQSRRQRPLNPDLPLSDKSWSRRGGKPRAAYASRPVRDEVSSVSAPATDRRTPAEKDKKPNQPQPITPRRSENPPRTGGGFAKAPADARRQRENPERTDRAGSTFSPKKETGFTKTSADAGRRREHPERTDRAKPASGPKGETGFGKASAGARRREETLERADRAKPVSRPKREGSFEKKAGAGTRHRTENPDRIEGDKPAFSPRKPFEKQKTSASSFRSKGGEAKPRAPARDVATVSQTAKADVRVSKLLSERGLCSRREADEYIERGWVFANGKRVTLGQRVSPNCELTFADQAKIRQKRRVTILVHKPVGYVSGQPEENYLPAVELVTAQNHFHVPNDLVFSARHLNGLAPAGRLDIDSTGLLVLTQDGRIARTLIGKDSEIEKEYLVRVEGTLVEGGLALLNCGLSLDDQPLKPAYVERINDDQLRFVLREGKKRQIRRMCELVGLKVTGLKRIRIGRVRLGNLPLGQWRYLRNDESF